MGAMREVCKTVAVAPECPHGTASGHCSWMEGGAGALEVVSACQECCFTEIQGADPGSGGSEAY